MRYGTRTGLPPEQVLDRARAFFGQGGELGLPETQAPPGGVAFAAPDGEVSVSARVADRQTEVTVLSREYDYWAERFVRELGAEIPTISPEAEGQDRPRGAGKRPGLLGFIRLELIIFGSAVVLALVFLALILVFTLR